MRLPESMCGRREFLRGLLLAIAAVIAAVRAQEKPTSLEELEEQLKSEKRATAAAAFAELEQRAKGEVGAQKVLDAYLERRNEFFGRCRISVNDYEFPFPQPSRVGRPRRNN